MKMNRLILVTVLSLVGACPLLRAQSSVPFDLSSSGVQFGMDANGVFYVQGGSGALTSGQGPQPWVPGMLWYPNKAAFFEGNQNNRYLGDANMGYDSAALGGGLASGDYSLAGAMSAASGENSIAFCNSTASSWCSIAAGYGSNAYNLSAVAIGIECSANAYSVAMGGICNASGSNSVAIGNGASANGYSSVALGDYNTTYNNDTFAAGCNTYAAGVNSTSFGGHTRSDSYMTFSLGTYNIGGGSWNTWVPTDPLFEIGNGTDSAHPTDAFIVYKNGNAVLQGSLQVAPTGDIPMYGGS